MKYPTIVLTIVASLALSPAVWGQQTLSSAEVQQILQQVTSQPRETWIAAGTIEAKHQEYGRPKVTDEVTIGSEISRLRREYQNNPNKREKTPELQKMAADAIPFNVRYRLANEYAMSSTVTAKYDHGRFYWEINVNSRSDTIKPQDYGAAGNQMTRQFNLAWNQRRIFAWDGQKYTTYSASANRVTVDTAGRLPRAVTGPLTAGLIPWGHDQFSASSLAAAQVSATRKSANTVQMTIAFSDGSAADLTLDATREYAVTEAVLTTAGGAAVTYQCSGYQLVGGNWVPTHVTVERRNEPTESRLPTSEQWTFTSVSATPPSPDSFAVPLAANAVVEYSSPVTASSSIYVQSNAVDMDDLLAQHLAYVAAGSSRSQNCATAALQNVASRFGKTFSAGALAHLVGPDGNTNLYDMKRFAESQGLYCRAVRTDLAGLRDLQDAVAILHIPERNHFVVLDRVDDRDVWLVDLSSRKFFYRRSVDFFPMDWPEGTALLLSDRPIAKGTPELTDAALAGLVGGNWECNTLLQESATIYCNSFFAGCSGAVIIYFERWGCGWSPIGSCSEDPWMVSSQDTTCVWNSFYYCGVTGEWYYYYMTACG